MNKISFLDAHSHLNFPDYLDLEEVISRMQENSVGTIVVGTDYESSKRAVELANKYENIWACIGVHPVDDPSKVWEEDKFESLMGPKVVAIGECGMDFFHINKEEDYARQKKLFLEQINFALNHDLPIMIHGRDSYEEILEVLEELNEPRLKGNMHFFTGNVSEAERFFKLGFTVSFTGVITFTHDYDEVVRCAPLDKILSETDAPWVAPVPYRGKRNEPTYVTEVVKKIAEIRNESLETIQKALISNTCRLFGLVLE